MSTTNLDIESILPDYELVDSAATKASIIDAVDTTGITDDNAFTLNGVTITAVGAIGGAGADEIQLKVGGGINARNNLRLAINGTENADVGYGANLDSAEGVDGVKATTGTGANLLSLEAEEAGLNSIAMANTNATPVTAAGLAGDTGTDASGTVQFPLSNLGITDNDLTIAEAQDDTGDYRKFLYHIVRKYVEYFAEEESVDDIGIGDGGTGYTEGDALIFSGGSPTVAATGVVNVTGGVITGTTIVGGSGYASTPTVTVSSATVTSTASLTAQLTENLPAQLTIVKGSLVENVTTGIITRQYNLTFGFGESGLEIATD